MKILGITNSQTISAHSLNKKQEENKSETTEIIRKQDSIEISNEGRIALNQMKQEECIDEKTEKISENNLPVKCDKKNETETEQKKGKVAFNAAKRARQLAAASTTEQVRAVLEMLRTDLSDCKAGVKNGMCTEDEVRKVEAMIENAHKRMSQVSQEKHDDNKNQAVEELAFNMASLM